MWNEFYDDQELKKIISLDINRTYQDNKLFHSTENKDILINILFVWCKENSSISYKQGMNEIMGVLYLGIAEYYDKATTKIIAEELLEKEKGQEQLNEEFIKDLLMYLNDIAYIQSDLYYFFNEIMKKGIRDLYENGAVEKEKSENSLVNLNLLNVIY